MAPIAEVQPGYSQGAPLLRFGAMIANVGDGDFQVAARRPAPWSEAWSVSQRVQEAEGGFTERVTPGGLVFGGDEHNHWHVEGLEEHRLERGETGRVVGTGEAIGRVLKQGFCPFDTDHLRPELSRSPAIASYPESGCGGAFAIGLRVGVSVGWGDEYPWHFIEQKIDLTGIPDGRYRLVQEADPLDWFEELDDENNETWVDVDIAVSGGIPTVKVVARPTDP
jgi:hypothetical protein